MSEVEERWQRETEPMRIWELEVGDVISMRIETGDPVRPSKQVEGTVSRILGQGNGEEFILKPEEARIEVNKKIYKVARIETFNIQSKNSRKPRQKTPERKRVQHPAPDANGHPRDEYDSSDEHEEGDDDWPKEEEEQTRSPTTGRPAGQQQSPSRNRHGRSQSKSVSQSEASDPEMRHHGRLMKKARDLKIKNRLKEIDGRTTEGKVEFKEVWKQVASQDLMRNR